MDLTEWISTGSGATLLGGLGYGINKYLIPAYKGLKKEIQDLRDELKEEIEKRIELETQLAYLKGKYAEKTVLKSHGKTKKYD